MPRLTLIPGDKPAPEKARDEIVTCTCPAQSRTYVMATTPLVRRKGKVVKAAGSVTQWHCLHCKRPVG